MAALGSKLRTLEGGMVAFRCPGCDEAHQITVEGETRPRWQFNGDGDRPTFSPSVLVQWGMGKLPPKVCHSFVTDGRIQFLNDCTHHLAGQTVELPDFFSTPA